MKCVVERLTYAAEFSRNLARLKALGRQIMSGKEAGLRRNHTTSVIRGIGGRIFTPTDRNTPRPGVISANSEKIGIKIHRP